MLRLLCNAMYNKTERKLLHSYIITKVVPDSRINTFIFYRSCIKEREKMVFNGKSAISLLAYCNSREFFDTIDFKV